MQIQPHTVAVAVVVVVVVVTAAAAADDDDDTAADDERISADWIATGGRKGNDAIITCR